MTILIIIAIYVFCEGYVLASLEPNISTALKAFYIIFAPILFLFIFGVHLATLITNTIENK